MADYKKIMDDAEKALSKKTGANDEYTVVISGKEFVILPNMFSPKYFRDTEFFASELPVKKGDHFLEIGPGCGAVSVIAALKGAAKVAAVDISVDSVENTKENARRHGVEIEVFHGSVYDPLPDDYKFDIIFWNAPFGFVERTGLSRLKKNIYDPGYKSTERFIKEAKNHLHPDGKIFLGFSSTLGKLKKIEKFFKQGGLKHSLVAKTTVQAGKGQAKPVTYELFEASL